MKPSSPLFKCCRQCEPRDCMYPYCLVAPKLPSLDRERFVRKHVRMPGYTHEETEAFHRLRAANGGCAVNLEEMRAMARGLQVVELPALLPVILPPLLPP